MFDYEDDCSATYEDGRENMITEIIDILQKIEKLYCYNDNLFEELNTLLDKQLKEHGLENES